MSLRKAWDRLWFTEFDPLSLGVFRICLGVLILVTFLALLPTWNFYFEPNGICQLRPSEMGGLQERANLFYYTQSFMHAKTVGWLGVVAAAFFIVGLQTRVATIFLFVLVSSMVHRCSYSVNGEDLVYRMLLFYSCFAPLGHSLSVDDWLRKRNGRSLPAPLIWPLRLMQINFALIYVFTQTRKMVSADVVWLNGDAMYYTMANTTWSRWPWPMLFAHSIVTKVTTFGSLFMELAFPILVWFRAVRIPVLLAMAFIHISIATTLQNVTFFSLSMVAGMWLFVPAEDTRRLAQFILGHFILAGGTSGASPLPGGEESRAVAGPDLG